MTWNVQNLLPVTHPDGPATAAAYEAKIAGLAAVIDAVAPDVLAVQEVGGDDELADLADACATDLSQRAVATADDRGIRVALLSARPLSRVRDRTAFPVGVRPVQARDVVFDDPGTAADEASLSSCGRGVLSATVTIDGADLTITVCHLKSKLITYARQPGLVGGSEFAPNDEGERLRYAGYALARRAAEAMTVRDVLDEWLTPPGEATGHGDGTGRETAIVCCGDLNDEPAAATTQIVQGPGGSEIDLRAGSGFTTPDRGDGWRLWNLAPLLPTEPAPATRIYRGRGELIDHVFASRRLVGPDRLPTVRLETATPLPSMTDVPAFAPPAPSDHAAVVATFSL